VTKTRAAAISGPLAEAVKKHSAVAASSDDGESPDRARPVSSRRKGDVNNEAAQPNPVPARARVHTKRDIPAVFTRPPDIAKMFGISRAPFMRSLPRDRSPRFTSVRLSEYRRNS
jgi:hypothetical protein